MNFSNKFINQFFDYQFKIDLIPKEYVLKELNNKPTELSFKEPKILYEYLENEKNFWGNYNNIFFQNYAKAYDNAINNLKIASTSNYVRNQLDNVKQCIAKIPNSNTVLAKELVKYNNYPFDFFKGYVAGISNDVTTIYQTNSYYILGLVKGFQYRDVILSIDTLIPEQQKSFENMQVIFSNKTNEFLEKYESILKKQKSEYSKLCDENRNIFIEQKKEYINFLDQSNEKINKLEHLYREKLRLEAPADYWKKMSDEYAVKGRNYFIISFVMVILSIIIVLGMFLALPKVFIDAHWFITFKYTAMITVVVSLLIYLLRITIKMSMSSYHLSRDAREREQLTYFYLSLIDESAVSDKERELIVTALFSRSETGLLKGDSSPEMPTINITDYLNRK